MRVRYWWFLLAVLWVSGCAKNQRQSNPDPKSQFPALYPEAEPAPSAFEAPPASSQHVTLSVKEMPVTDFLRVLAAKYGISVMWSESMDKRLVSVEADGVPIEDIFTSLSRRFNVAIERVGSSWYVGEFRENDRACLVRKALRLSQEDLTQCLQTVLGESGRARAFKDGLIVVADRAENLRRVAQVLDQVEATRADSWVLQLYLFSTSKAASRDLGIDSTALIDLATSFATSSFQPGQGQNGNLASKFAAVMKATASREDVRLVGKPLFVLGDGEHATFTSGVSVPVPKKTVSDQGTVTTSGFEYVQSGLSAEAGVREGGRGTVLLTLKCTLGQITGYVEEAPVQAKDEFSTVAVLASSGVYLLGALDRDEGRMEATGLMDNAPLRRKAEQRESQIQVWARLYRIAGPVK